MPSPPPHAPHPPGSALNCFGPNLNIFRDPRFGRGAETYGEDPHLSGSLAAAFVAALQRGAGGGEGPRAGGDAGGGGDAPTGNGGNGARNGSGGSADGALAADRSGSIKVGATCKHWAAYSLEQAGGYTRLEYDAHVSPRCVHACACVSCVCAQAYVCMCA